MSIAKLVLVIVMLLLGVSLLTLFPLTRTDKLTKMATKDTALFFTVGRYCLLAVIFLVGVIFCARQFNIEPLSRILDTPIF